MGKGAVHKRRHQFFNIFDTPSPIVIKRLFLRDPLLKRHLFLIYPPKKNFLTHFSPNFQKSKFSIYNKVVYANCNFLNKITNFTEKTHHFMHLFSKNCRRLFLLDPSPTIDDVFYECRLIILENFVLARWTIKLHKNISAINFLF